MKKTIQILFLVFLSLTVFAREKKDTLKKESKWSIQLFGGPNYCFPTFTGSPPENGKGLYEYGITILTNRAIGKYSVINFGASYQYLKYKTWLSYNPSCVVNYDYSFINTILSIRFISNNKKSNVSLDIGATGNYFYNDRKNNYINGGSPFSDGHIIVSFLFSPGFHFKLNNRFTVDFMAGFSLALIPLKYKFNSSVGTEEYENSVQYLFYNIGLQYHF